MTDIPILYDYWRSSASYRVRIALALKGIAYDAVCVNLLDADHRAPAHLARNPQGLVPALAIDGQMLTQSLAIIEYLDETRAAHPLVPSVPLARARVRALAHAIAMEIHPICNLSVATHVADLTGDPDAKQAWMKRFIRRGLEAFEVMLNHPQTGICCHGDQPGLADCCLIPQLYNAERWQVDIDDLQRIKSVAAHLNTLPAVQAAHPDHFQP